MSESIRLKQDEQIQELKDLVEVLQKENEDKDKVLAEKDVVLAEQSTVIAEQTELIAEKKMQLQECLELNERLNRENRNASVQVLQKDLKQTKDTLESVRGKLFWSELTIESLQNQLHASEEARKYAET